MGPCHAESDMLVQLRFLKGNSFFSWVVLEVVLAHQSSQWISCLYPC